MAIGEISLRDVIEFGDSELFAKQLAGMTDVDRVIVSINAPGGSAWEGIAMLFLLSNHPTPVTTRVEGIAASAAAIVMAGGSQIEAFEHSTIMVHRASSGVLGTGADMRKIADVLDQLDRQIAGVFSNRAGGSVQDWLSLLEVETYFDADEAKAIGLVDEILPSRRGSRPASTKVAASTGNRSVRAAAFINSLKRGRKKLPGKFPASYPGRRAAVIARAREVNSHWLEMQRARNRETIVANAKNRERALPYLRAS